MKFALIILNVFLTVLLGCSIFAFQIKGDAVSQYSVKKSSHSNSSKSGSETGKTENVDGMQSVSMVDDGAVISELNIFNSARCANARVMGRSNGQKQLDMNLVGVFKLGDKEGAIILQKTKVQPAQPRPGVPPGQQRTPQQTDNVSYKQYVLLGETLSNGYMLVSVTRTSAVLEKGSDRIELGLLEPSKNQTGALSSGKAQNNQNNRNNWQRPPGMMWRPPPGMWGGGRPWSPGMMNGNDGMRQMPTMNRGDQGNNQGRRRRGRN